MIARLRYVWSRFDGAARWRAFYWVILRRWETEICTSCGRPVRVVWWCSDDRLWTRVTGHAMTPGSKEAAAGVMCIYCFDTAAKGETDWLEWTCLNLRHLSRDA